MEPFDIETIALSHFHKLKRLSNILQPQNAVKNIHFVVNFNCCISLIDISNSLLRITRKGEGSRLSLGEYKRIWKKQDFTRDGSFFCWIVSG